MSIMQKRAIITSALPYANGEMHIGHVASTYLPADVVTRFLRMRGVEAYYICASDDFGTPILIKSEQESKTPADYTAHWHRRDQEDFESMDICFDYFYRTSAPECVAFAQKVFEKLNAAGHIYTNNIVQYYCENDRKFLPDRYILGECPHCNATDQYSDLCESCGSIPEQVNNPRCAICGQTPVSRTTNHYFFKLKDLAEPLGRWLDTHPNLQSDVKRYVRNWIKNGLVDWDITRDIPWGVPVPLDEASGKVFYGWFDNHLSYISSTTKFLSERGIDAKEFWNTADIYHFIGKDIVYHHYLYLPAIRLGINSEYKLPDYMPVRGHLKLQSQKLSKSRNWYIGLRDFVKIFPPDYLRYYLLSATSYSQQDLNFDWDDFAARINSDLIDNLGNFVNRALGFATRAYGGIIPEPDTDDKSDIKVCQAIESLATETSRLMEAGHTDRALRTILEFSARFNQYFQHKEPWRRKDGAQACIFYSVNAVYSITVAISPFMPGSSARIWHQLGMPGDITKSSWSDISKLAIKPGHKLGAVSPLFTKIKKDMIHDLKSKLGSK